MRGRREGYTLIELMTVLTIVGVLASLVAPSLRRFLAQLRTRQALNEFSIDYAYARMLAVRNGARVEVAFLAGEGCRASRPRRAAAAGYRITVQGAAPQVVREVRLRGGGVCLETTNDPRIVLGSRGLPLPFENRTVWARSGAVADSLTISVVGRVLRRS